jgi:hypothetical protein
MAIKPEAVVAAAACLVLVAGSLLATAGLSPFLHWRAEARQEVAMAARARQAIAWGTPSEFRQLPPTEQVLVMPAVVAGR